MSKGGYNFNSHREALYRLLEATVRDEPSGIIPDATRDQPSAYPSPVLWYEEMRPSDIDAYHAANGRGRTNRRGDDASKSSFEDPLAGSIPTPTTTSMDSGGECSKPRSHGEAKSRSREALQGSGNDEGGAVFGREGRRPAARTPVRRQTGEEGSLGETQPAVPGSAGSTSGNDAPDRFTRATDPTQLPVWRRGQCPHDKTSSVSGEDGEDERAAATSTGSSSAHDACRRRCPKPLELEEGECHPKPNMMMSTPTLTAAATTTTPPDPPSQGTQPMFLPGLPSQVLVTQPQGNAGGWEQPEGDESPQKEAEGAAASEYAFPSPSPCAEEAAVEDARVASVGGGEESFDDGGTKRARPEPPDRSKNRCGGNNDALVAGSDDQDEVTSRQNDGFTLALREFVDELDPAQGGASANRGGEEDQLRPPFEYLPTAEVLPSGWLRGQGRAVAFLEKQVSQARARCPGGYAVRALQLACHVLRQPTVCVRVRGDRGNSGVATGGAAAADCGRHEVVGIAEFVWDILRANGRDIESVTAS
eukprot:g6385.t1